MVSKWKDGGAAFPRPSYGANEPADGMTLRDWFAGQALAGLCANSRDHCEANTRGLEAYLLADAMLIARAKGE